eukprot:Lankesteria_metandrocarpae@DN6899_c0_g1_i1.p1
MDSRWTMLDWTSQYKLPIEIRNTLQDLHRQLPTWTAAATPTKCLNIYTDASDTGHGAAIFTHTGDLLRHWSGKSTVSHQDAGHKELSALLECLRHNKVYLGQYAHLLWKIHLDNLPSVCWLRRSTVPVDHHKANLVMKILEMLKDQEYTIHHVAGVANSEADRMSRLHT